MGPLLASLSAAALIAGGAPEQVLGIAVAVLVLMPETWAAVRAGYEWGLEPTDLVMLVLTFLVAPSILVSGRTRVPPGAVHLAIFAAFLFLAFVP